MTNTELAEVIKNLLKACNELMTEFISRKRAANWEIINDAMVAGERARAAIRKAEGGGK